MKNSNTIERIYRDERFPGVEVRNSGGAIFNVWTEGERRGMHNEHGWCNIDCFTRYPDEPELHHNADSAEAVVVEWFDDLLMEVD